MRPIVILILSSALLAGCKHPRTSSPPGTAGQAASKKAEKNPTKGSAGRESKTSGSTAVAVNEPAGKVASVNPGLRFVVIDFALNPVPQVDQRMAVYRGGQKVGEVKISSQMRNSIIAADITAGDARVGDEIRPQ